MLSLALVSQGVVQTFSAYTTVPLVESVEYDNPKVDAAGQPIKDDKGNPVTEKATQKEQVIAVGPAASQIAIKQLGTNGGGFFNVNSAHPFENPTPLSNFLEMLAILLIGGALCYTFGRMVGDTRQGWAMLAAMTIVFVALLAVCVRYEQSGNPALANAGADTTASALQAGGNMEGKETRFGIVNSALWATATTSASNGSVNSMHDSFTPLGGLVPMWLIQLGEVIFGGVGSGLYGMLMFAIVAVFVAGLMIGRTPEYLGKKIEAFEIKMASIAVLVPTLCVLVGTAIAVMVDAGKAGVANPGDARLFRDPLRLLVGGQQQRQRVCGTLRQHAVLQHGPRARDVLRPLLGHRPGARDRGLARREEESAGRRRHAAHAHAAVRRRADRHRDRRRRAHLLPRARAGPGRRTPRHDRRSLTRRTDDHPSNDCASPSRRGVLAPRARDAADLSRCAEGLVRQAAAQHQWRNPVMFVVWIGSVLTTILWIQALAGTGEARRDSSSP